MDVSHPEDEAAAGDQALHLSSAPLVPCAPWQKGSSRMALLPSCLPCGYGGQRCPAGAVQPVLLRCSDFVLGCPALHNPALNRKELTNFFTFITFYDDLWEMF